MGGASEKNYGPGREGDGSQMEQNPASQGGRMLGTLLIGPGLGDPPACPS